MIGSGPIVIGQAAEFDYAGTQACRSLREEGVQTVLVNSNPATIMTDAGVADVTYIEPLTVEMVERHRAARAAGRPPADARRSDRPEPGRRLRRGRRPRALRRSAARHAARDDQEGRGPRPVQADAAQDRRAGAGQRHGATPSTRRWRSPRIERLPGHRAAGLHARRHRRRRRPATRPSCGAWRPAAWRPARSTRCSSSSR